MIDLQISFGSTGVEIAASRPLAFPLAGESSRRATSDEEPSDALLVLEGLWADELVDQLAPGKWHMPWDSLLDVEDSDARVVGLPRVGTFESSLHASGIPSSPDFGLEISVRDRVHGPLDLGSRRGPAIVLDDGEAVLLSKPLLTLVERVESRPSPSADTTARLLYLARCKDAAIVAGAALDAFLTEQQIDIAPPVGVSVEETSDGALEIEPSVDELTGSDLVLGNGSARSIVNARDKDGRRRRVVLDPASQQKVEAIARVQRLEGPAVPEFLSNPESLLPEGIDLSKFSDRVQGFKVRVYNSRPYVHIRKHAIGWFDYQAGVKLDDSGVTGSDDGSGAREAPELDPDEYADLARRARESGSRWVQRGDDWIEIDPDAESQFTETVRKFEESRSSSGVRASVVLDVISNVEELGFRVDCPELPRDGRPWLEELPEVSPPDSFTAVLDPHQVVGFRWLVYLASRGLGGLLADDMGLGKTAQVIAHLCVRQAESTLRPSLIVVPKTLVNNWLRELRIFAPSISDVVVHEGPNRPRRTDHLASHDLVITTYDTVRQDQVGLGIIDWQLVALDEAQFIKNPTAGRTSAVKALKCEQLVAMTGTPVENGLIEFWSIMDRVRHGMLGGWSDFRDTFERPLADAAAEDRNAIVESLLASLDPHYLRRTKDEVLGDLPPKEIHQGPRVKLGPLQHELYMAALGELQSGGRGIALVTIGRLLRICAHPRTETGDWDQLSADELLAECPKLGATMELVSQIRSASEKVVIFAEWKSTQRILQRAISQRFDCWPEVINGDVTDRRQEIIDAFCQQPGFGAIILSPKVAGFGLNIVEANHVIHYTRPWNPAIENQATDRVHRRGQTRRVHVYYPTVEGGVEEALADLLDQKSALARDVLRPSSERTVSANELYERLN